MYSQQTKTSDNKNGYSPAASSGTGLGLQCMLDIGSVNDPLEAEADAMADRVMRMPDTPLVQRKCAGCEEEKEKLQRKPLAVSITPFIQTKGAEGGTTSDAVASQISASKGGGSGMDKSTQSFMENRFGTDFSNVKIHTDNNAVQMSQELRAQAFTVGKDIYFNGGKYNPESKSGKQLLAHELTHTLQQSATIDRKIQRRWDSVGANCPDVPTSMQLDKVEVEQEIPQSVTLNWNNGTTEAAIASAGKGQCCTDTSSGVACDVGTSRTRDTNCTPITSGAGYTISDRYLNYNGWEFWNTFVGGRGIALHQHHTVTGEPLSHGCVRLNRDTARRIFCGARQNQTRVQVKGFARPACNSANLQSEWLADLAYAQIPTDGESASVVRGIRETRATLRRAFGVANDTQLNTLMAGLTATNIASRIPRCSAISAVTIPANSTTEEARVFNESINVNPFSLVFATRIIEFIRALQAATSLIDTQTVVNNAGLTLYQAAQTRAQAPAVANIDDRPLYWTRLRMIEEIRRFNSRFTISAMERQQLIDGFEQRSRGLTSVSFSAALARQKKVLISGFDPFGFNVPLGGTGTDSTLLDSNPSGAAVLALNGQTISGTGGLSAFVQGVIFPVRYRDFDQGIIENLFRPFLDNTTPVSMIMTISQGSNRFDVENTAGRRRSTASFADNEGVLSGGSTTNPVVPSGMAAGSEFLKTQLPHSQMATVPNTSLNTAGATSTTDTQGNTIAVTGTGGGFLSNEIFYRVRLLQTNIGGSMKNLPVGHLHIPNEDQMTRVSIVNRIKEIIAAALPALP